jgi:hypothetical protein
MLPRHNESVVLKGLSPQSFGCYQCTSISSFWLLLEMFRRVPKPLKMICLVLALGFQLPLFRVALEEAAIFLLMTPIATVKACI